MSFDYEKTQATGPGSSIPYHEALDYLYGRINYERTGLAPYNQQNYRLDRMRGLLDQLGNPQREYRVIHIAGTKGKGSVAHLVSHCLSAAGLSCGLATSPHLWRLEERFRIQGEPASSEQLVRLTEQIGSAAEKIAEERGPPTFFEMTTAMAFLHFAQSAVQWAVIEVGLGGRLDSTNVCEPEVCVITSISLDHQRQLGSTIAEIAGEKAGIIKPGVPVICTAREPAAQRVIEETATANGCPLRLIERDFDVEWQPCEAALPSQGAAFAQIQHRSEVERPLLGDSFTVQTQLLGQHQADNIAAALEVLNQIEAQDAYSFTPDGIREAIRGCKVPARLEVTQADPPQVLDTAHNPASLEAGLLALAAHFPPHELISIFASSKDKDWKKMLRQLMRASSVLVLTSYLKNPRAASLPILQAEVAAILNEEPGLSSCQVLTATSPDEAWQMATQWQSSDESNAPRLVYATGSFFLAAELPRRQPTDSRSSRS